MNIRTKIFTRRTWAWLIGIALIAAFLGYWYWQDSHSLVVLLPDGEASFYMAALFHRDKYKLTLHRGKWRLWGKDEAGSELILPFECPYNDYKILRLENNGKVYLLDKKTMTRMELRVVDGEWSYDASDHWQSIFDLE